MTVETRKPRHIRSSADGLELRDLRRRCARLAAEFAALTRRTDQLSQQVNAHLTRVARSLPPRPLAVTST